MAVPLMVAFMNIGLKEEAFQGSRSEQHCVNIRLQVQELRIQHNVTMYCFVEAGEPRVGLTDKSKKLFMQAVAAGASEHGTPEISFIWALNESLVAAFPAKLGRHCGCPQLEQACTTTSHGATVCSYFWTGQRTSTKSPFSCHTNPRRPSTNCQRLTGRLSLEA